MHHKIQQEIKSKVIQKENQVYHVCFIQRVLAILVQIVPLHMWIRKHQPRRRQNSRPRLLPQQKQPLPLFWPAVQARFLELKPAIPASTSFASNFASTLRYAFAPFSFLLSVFAAVSSSITSTDVCISASLLPSVNQVGVPAVVSHQHAMMHRTTVKGCIALSGLLIEVLVVI